MLQVDMAETNGFFHSLGSAVVQRVVFGTVTLLLGIAGFLAKLEYNNVDERIDNNSSAVIKVSDELKQVDVKYSSVRDEQIRRRGVLDKLQADVAWLWQEGDKHKVDMRALYAMVQAAAQVAETKTHDVHEKQVSNISAIERLRESATRLETQLAQLEKRIRWLEERQPVYRSDEQQTLQRGR